MYDQPLRYFFWLFLICLGMIYRLWHVVTTRLYYFITRKNPFSELKAVKNVVFVGGFLSFVPSEMPFIHYWGALGSRVAWAPMIGPVSSLSDRACELFYAVFAKNPTEQCIHYRDDLCGCKVDHAPSKPMFSPLQIKWWVRLVTALLRFFGHNDPDKNLIKQPVTVPESRSQGIRNALTFIAHSAGGGTVNAMLVMLVYHHRYLVDHGFDVEPLPASLELDKLCPDLNRKASSPVFVDGGRPYMITPNSIKRVVYISSPLGGIEYVRHGSNMSDQGIFKRARLGWWVALMAKLLDIFWGRTNGVLYDFFLGQFSSPMQFAQGCDHIAHDFIGPNQRALTDRAMHVLRAYGIEELRVVTHASVPVRRSPSQVVNLLRPGACLLLHLFALAGCGWACDQGEAEGDATGPHDGVVTVPSQMYGHKGSQCKCKHEGGFPVRCTECGLWHLGVDHIEIVGTFGSTKRVRALYASLFDLIAKDEQDVLIF